MEESLWHIRQPSSTMQVFCGAPVTWQNIQPHGIAEGRRGGLPMAILPRKFRVTVKELVSPSVHGVCCEKCLNESGLIESDVEVPF
jgi:hypothetical protein